MDDLPGWLLLPLLVVLVIGAGWLLSRRARKTATESEQEWQSTHLHVPSGLDTGLEAAPSTGPAALSPEGQAADVADRALREAQDSARRELAEREAADRTAAAQEAQAAAAAARAAAARAEAERRQAELDAERQARLDAERQARIDAERQARLDAERQARIEADRQAEAAALEAARAAAAEREIQRQAAERQELERREAARREAQRQAQEAQALQAELQAEFERLQAGQAESAAQAAEQAAERAAEQARQEKAAAEAEAAARAAAEAARRPPVQPPAAARQAADTLVMVVDDSKVVRVKTSRLLAQHQFRVALAEDGQAALAVMAQEQPQVLITDVEMPGMDGLSLTRAVRADARMAALPVVMITSADDRLKDEAAAAGVTVLMGKPYTDHELVGHVARLAGVSLAA